MPVHIQSRWLSWLAFVGLLDLVLLPIGCSVHYIPLHLQPYWRDTYKLTPEMFPVSQWVFERTVSLPLYTRMTDADVARVVAAVKVALG